MDDMTSAKPFSICDNLPQEIVDAYDKKQLAIFIGAGVSRLANCKSWQALGSELIEDCYKKGFINFRIKEKYRNSSESKKVVTIAYNIYKDHNAIDDFFKIFENALNYDKNKTSIYQLLYNICDVFITTNADEIFAEIFKETDNFDSIKYLVEDFKSIDLERLPRKTLFEIHGRKSDRDSLVFTADQYITRYNSANFQTFLNKIFNKYTVLFIGYGLAEFELLDYIIAKGNSGKTHFLLLGKYQNDDLEFLYESLYYKSLNIKTIPFELDAKGYEQQVEEIQALREKLFIQSRVKSESDLHNEILSICSKKDANALLDRYIDIPGIMREIKSQLYLIKKDQITDFIFISLYERNSFYSQNLFSTTVDKTIKWIYFDFLHLVFQIGKTTFLNERVDLLKNLSVNDDFSTPYVSISLFDFIFSLNEEYIKEFVDYIRKALLSNSSVLSYSFADHLFEKIVLFNDEKLFFLLFDIVFASKDSHNSVVESSALQVIIKDHIDDMLKKYEERIVEHLINVSTGMFHEGTLYIDEKNLNIFDEEYDYYVSLGNLIYHLSLKYKSNAAISQFLSSVKIGKRIDYGTSYIYSSKELEQEKEVSDFDQLIAHENTNASLSEAKKQIIHDYFKKDENLFSLPSKEIKSYEIKNVIIHFFATYYEDKNTSFGIDFILDFLEKDFFNDSFIEAQKVKEKFLRSAEYSYVTSACGLISSIFGKLDRKIDLVYAERFLAIVRRVYNSNKASDNITEYYSTYFSSIASKTNTGRAAENIIFIAIWAETNYRESDFTKNIFSSIKHEIQSNQLVLTAVFALYLGHFYNLKEDWAEMLFKSSLFKTNREYMIEHFWYGNRRINKELLIYLDSIGKLEELVSLEIQKPTSDILLSNFLIAFLNGVKLKFNLLNILDWDSPETKVFITIIYKTNMYLRLDRENKFSEDFIAQLKILQSELYQRISQLDDPVYKANCAVDIVKWLVVLDNLQDVFENGYFKLITPDSFPRFNWYNLVKTLLVLSKKSANVNYVIKVLLSFAERKIFFEYPQEELKKLFQALYSSNSKKSDKLLRWYLFAGHLSQELYKEITIST